MTSAQLRVLAIVDTPAAVSLFARVFSGPQDRVLIARDLAEGLALAATEPPDLAFVDVTLGHNAGLALVHHLRAVAPDAMVYALASAESLQIGAQATALGAAGLIMMPASGDELASAASEARTRMAARAQTSRLQEEARVAQRTADLATRVAALAESPDRGDAAKKLARVFAELTGAKAALVYLPATEGSAELAQSGTVGRVSGAPTFSDEMGLMTFARQHDCELVPLAIRQIAEGHVLLWGLSSQPWSVAERSVAEMVAGQAATTLALLGERERSTRGAIKDRTTSAYTFAYFVDIAGREIDKARRYGRRFALATIAAPEGGGEESTDLAEIVLSSVRDTDVLARVDEGEFYLLMPETGGVGAQSCRRRVLQVAAARSKRSRAPQGGTPLTIGLATYPHDGTDLSKLLRAAKRRADAAQHSLANTLKSGEVGLSDLVDGLVARCDASPPPAGDFEGARPIRLPLRAAIQVATAAVSEATRGGPTFVAVAHHPDFGLSSSIRASVGHEREGLSLHVLDLRAVPGCSNLQLLTVIGEHGAYLLAGRLDSAGLRGVHASDPLLVDLVTLCAGQTAGVRLLE